MKIQIGEQRYYHIDGKHYPSVTTILKYGLPKPIELELWEYCLGEEAVEIRDFRSLIGIFAHYRAASYLAAKYKLPIPVLELKRKDLFQDNLAEVKRIMRDLWANFKFWEELYQPMVYRVEHTVVNKELGYAGTLDLIAKIKGRLCLIDIKTSKACYPNFHAQVMGYKMCFKLPLYPAILRVNENDWEFNLLDSEEQLKGECLFKEALRNFQSKEYQSKSLCS